MKKNTVTYLNKALELEWLNPSNVRRKVENERLVTNWSKAEEMFFSEKFINLINAKGSALRRAVLEKIRPVDMDEDEPDDWDRFMDEWKKVFQDRMYSKALVVARSIGSEYERFPNYLVDGVKAAGWETEFSDWAPDRFCRDWCDWLLSGYLGCYWDGDLEEGQFVLFDLR